MLKICDNILLLKKSRKKSSGITVIEPYCYGINMHQHYNVAQIPANEIAIL